MPPLKRSDSKEKRVGFGEEWMMIEDASSVGKNLEAVDFGREKCSVRGSSGWLRLLLPSDAYEDQTRLTPYMAVSTRSTVLARR